MYGTDIAARLYALENGVRRRPDFAEMETCGLAERAAAMVVVDIRHGRRAKRKMVSRSWCPVRLSRPVVVASFRRIHGCFFEVRDSKILMSGLTLRGTETERDVDRRRTLDVCVGFRVCLGISCSPDAHMSDCVCEWRVL